MLIHVSKIHWLKKMWKIKKRVIFIAYCVSTTQTNNLGCQWKKTLKVLTNNWGFSLKKNVYILSSKRYLGVFYWWCSMIFMRMNPLNTAIPLLFNHRNIQFLTENWDISALSVWNHFFKICQRDSHYKHINEIYFLKWYQRKQSKKN